MENKTDFSKLRGRPKGKSGKAVFPLSTLLNKLFPDHIAEREYLTTRIGTAMSSGGKTLYAAYINETKRLTARQAAVAKCFDCCGYYDDGKKDCGCPLCPLYPFMPYRKKEE